MPALEQGFTPANYNAGNFYGLSTLRLGVEKSRNAMTVRLANEMGMKPVMGLSKRFGIYDAPQPELAWALGAGETTLMRLATAYSAMINGGKAVEPRILDRIQDGSGKTVFNGFEVDCADCLQTDYRGGPPPALPDMRKQVIDPVTAYQVTYIMQGVVQNGTGAKLRALGRPLGGKTGTTNDSFDNWFMGFSPDLVVGVYVGMDTPQQMGRETGSSSAVPIVKDFMETVLKSQSKVPFRIPDDFGSGSNSYGGFFGSTPTATSEEAVEDAAEDTIEPKEKTASAGGLRPGFDFNEGIETPDFDASEELGDLTDILERADQAVSDVRTPSELPEEIAGEVAEGQAQTGDISQGVEPIAPLDAPAGTALEDPLTKPVKKQVKKAVEKALDDGLY